MALRAEFIAWLKTQRIVSNYDYFAQELTGTSNQIVIADYGGVTNPTNPAFVAFMQVNLYHANRLTAENDSTTLYKALHQHDKFLLPTYRIESILVNQYPFEQPKVLLDNDRILYRRVFNIQLYVVENE